ncbi:hypothetical protein D3C72_1634730 [compost metagenome]
MIRINLCSPRQRGALTFVLLTACGSVSRADQRPIGQSEQTDRNGKDEHESNKPIELSPYHKTTSQL